MGRGTGGGDSSVGGTEEENGGACDPGEGVSELLESQEANPGQLACASSAIFLGRPIRNGTADLDG